ncbi:S-adenosyl-L-methionine-dependent methyltransferase [Geopyxis carbonaria]|nr:S-adenosyl-L-methionine-dependent methyltransferase [Geopyxis carbonaria]
MPSPLSSPFAADIEIDLRENSPDDDDNDDDSGSLPDSTYSSNHTSASGMLSLRDANTYENGRRYHGYRSGRYMLPNDETEQERMDLHHHCFIWHFGGELHQAPLHRPRRILDVGAGTGTWCLSIAEEFPDAEITGIDLSVIDPIWTPANVRFQIDDAEDPWPFPPAHFDYIHIRGLCGCIRSWPQLLAQATRALAPGGYLELVDHTAYFASDDGSTHPSHYLQRWVTAHTRALALNGFSWVDATQSWEPLLRELGLQDVRWTARKAPVGTWAKRKDLKIVGRLWQQMFAEGAEGIGMRPLCTVLGWDQEETRVFLEGVRSEMRDPRIRSYCRIMAMWARKPEEGAGETGNVEGMGRFS